MRGTRMRKIRLAVSLSAGLLWALPARSADIPDPAADHFEAESVANIGSFGSYYADFSLTLSPYAPYYAGGLKFRFTASDTRYTYPVGTFISKGQDAQTDFLVGYGWNFDRWSLLVFAGPSVVWSWQTPGDSSARTSLTRAGVKASISIYANPTDRTMVYAESSYSSASNAYYAQLKFGKAFWPDLVGVYVGPEVSAAGRAIDFMSIASGFQQWRAGAFVSGFTLGPLQLGISAGYLNDRQQGNGAYVGTSVHTTF